MDEIGAKGDTASGIIRIEHGAKSAVDFADEVFAQLRLVSILSDQALNEWLELCEKREAINTLSAKRMRKT
jgi:hypothetical protein